MTKTKNKVRPRERAGQVEHQDNAHLSITAITEITKSKLAQKVREVNERGNIISGQRIVSIKIKIGYIFRRLLVVITDVAFGGALSFGARGALSTARA